MVQKVIEVSKTTPIKIAAGLMLGVVVSAIGGTYSLTAAMNAYNYKLEQRLRMLEEAVADNRLHHKHRWSWQMEADAWEEYERNGHMGKPDVERIRDKWQWLFNH